MLLTLHALPQLPNYTAVSAWRLPPTTVTGEAPTPVPVDTPAPVDAPTDESLAPVAPTLTPEPGPTTPGLDLNRWEYLGCFENPPIDVVDFDAIPSDDSLTPTVSFGDSTT